MSADYTAVLLVTNVLRCLVPHPSHSAPSNHNAVQARQRGEFK